MKILYKLCFICLAFVVNAASAQIQKITFPLAGNKSVGIARLSPVPSNTALKIPLNGEWLFSENIDREACKKPIQVPGEWVMQGFEVEKGKAAGYLKKIDIPSSWKNKRVKLRFDGVYSDAEIWVNGQKTGTHLGGFTPFEIDITAFVKWSGSNELLVKVKSDSKADSLASASQYAVHALGGISRKVYLVALEDVNLAYADVKTSFDAKFENAVLTTDIVVANEKSSKSGGLTLQAELFSPGEKGEKIADKSVAIEKGLESGKLLTQTLSFDVLKPQKWDPEHPFLYTLRLSLKEGNRVKSQVDKRIGFRQIDVKGNRVLVNNIPVKLRGVCHHETMPLRGRSVNDNQWEKDVKIFREGNVNYIRTSHYPPPEELVAACDKLGMFLEVEAPFCWAENTTVPIELADQLLVNQTMDMVSFFRSSPSVLIWSLGNESLKYKEYFKKTGELVKLFDPTRPRNFSQYGPDGDDGELEIGNHHYPGPGGPEQYRNSKRPIVFDEYVHLNAYNRLELVTDPGVRDAWGIGFEAMWEKMQKTDAVLGGAIWAGIDDSFFLPNGKTVGYGTWGPVDGWRREKPEYWHMKKIYSPVKIKLAGNWNEGKVEFLVENRQLFSNLNECRIEWSIGQEKGNIVADVKPGASSKLSLALNNRPSPVDPLMIKVFDARNVMIDVYQFDVVPAVVTVAEKNEDPQSWTYQQEQDRLITKNKRLDIRLNLKNGNLEQIRKEGKTIILSNGQLMILPLTGEGRGVQMTGENQQFDPFTDVCKNRVVKEVKVSKMKNELTVSISDEYEEAFGVINYHYFANGKITADYKYTLKKDINPRQWGMVFNLPASYNELNWTRKGQWNYYPADHIGRLTGKAKLLSDVEVSGAAGPSRQPGNSWSTDRNEMGTNDFRSTKMNIKEASLNDGADSLRIQSDGAQHLRAWKNGQNIEVLVAGYSNMGAERFFRPHAEKMDRPLKAGDVIQDKIQLQIDRP
jgi:beta-galactosidase